MGKRRAGYYWVRLVIPSDPSSPWEPARWVPDPGYFQLLNDDGGTFGDTMADGVLRVGPWIEPPAEV